MVGDFGTSRKHVHMQLPITNKNTFSPITAQAVTLRLPMAGVQLVGIWAPLKSLNMPKMQKA